MVLKYKIGDIGIKYLGLGLSKLIYLTSLELNLENNLITYIGAK